MDTKTGLTIIAVAALLLAGPALGKNYPCSGSKGGVSHCENGRFVCNDGSISQSKRTCTASDAPAGKGPTAGEKKTKKGKAK